MSLLGEKITSPNCTVPRRSQSTSTLVTSLESYDHPDEKMEKKSHKNYVCVLLVISDFWSIRSELLDQSPYYIGEGQRPYVNYLRSQSFLMTHPE